MIGGGGYKNRILGKYPSIYIYICLRKANNQKFGIKIVVDYNKKSRKPVNSTI